MTATIRSFSIYQTQHEYEERLAQCEIEAGRYFDQAVQRQRAEFHATMQSLLGVTGPRWDRERAAASAKWRDDTAEARKLFEATVECLMETGEVSEQLDNEWTALIDDDSEACLDRVAVAMAAE